MSYSKVVLVGNLVADVEVRHIPSGTAVADVTVAVNEPMKSGEETSFVDVTVWGVTAERLSEYCGKGNKVLVDGRLRQEKWTDKESGKNRSKLSVTANRVVFLTMKDRDEEQNKENKVEVEGTEEDEAIPF